MICGTGGTPAEVVRQLATLTSCCLGAAEGGPLDCTCWHPEYDLTQGTLARDEPVPATRSAMCADCAYRPTSPERSGDERYSQPPDPATAAVFWCHQGLRKPLRWRHRTLGITVEATTDSYEPPMRVHDNDGRPEVVPYKANGLPADRCAGWAAHQVAEARMASEVLAELDQS